MPISNFINKAKSNIRSFWNNSPSYLQKARTFASTAIHHIQKGHRAIEGVNRAVQDSPKLFNEQVRSHAGKFTERAGKATQKLSELQDEGDKFIDKVQGNLRSVT